MKKFYYVLLCTAAAAMLLWVMGCSTEQPESMNGPAGVVPEDATSGEELTVNASDAIYIDLPDDEATITAACCISPYVQCLSSTDTSLTIRICAGSTGAPGGFRLLWAAVPEGMTCNLFPFPTNGVPQISIPGPVAAYSCRTVTITGLACGTLYTLRGYAINQYDCASPPSARLCCATATCEELPPCPDVPTVTCYDATESSITIRICNGPQAGVLGYQIQYMPLPAGVACAAAVWPANPATTTLATPVAPSACANVTIGNLDCNTTYVFRVLPMTANTYCVLPYSPNLCCTTDECEQTNCPLPPTVECWSATDTSITVRICAGASGAPCGLELYYVIAPDDLDVSARGSCEGLASAGRAVAVVPIGPLAPNMCTTYTLYGLECEMMVSFRAQALGGCAEFDCPSDYSATVCCWTDDCEVPCLSAPTVECWSRTDTSLTVKICAGPSGAPCGLFLHRQPLPADDARVVTCTGVDWVTLPYQIVEIAALGPNACTYYTFNGLECESIHAFRAKARDGCDNVACASDYSSTVCCQTATCEEIPPCPDVPTVECWSQTDTSLTVKICAGLSGAPCGITLKAAPVNSDPSRTPDICAAFVWPTTGVLTADIGPLAAGQCTYYTFNGLECASWYAFKAKADTDCDSYVCDPVWSNNVCCRTNDCEEIPCLETPQITCYDATENSITVRICAGPLGAPGGVVLQNKPVPAATACGAVTWAAGTYHSQNVGPIAPNSCVDVVVGSLGCETNFAFRAMANGFGPYCASDFSGNLCCPTDDCEEIPCVDEPTVACYDATENSLTVRICAGPSGLPGGFTLQRALIGATASCAGFTWPQTGVTTTNYTSALYQLAPNACVNITISNLECETRYAFRVMGRAFNEHCASTWSDNACCLTDDCETGPGGCTYTQGYWKNHPDAWPVLNLTIGSQNYTQLQLIATLQRSSAGGNALVILAKQLIAAKLNILNGADGSAVAATIAQADALIGALNITNGSVASNTPTGQQMVALAAILDNYNNGLLGVPHCNS